MLTDYNIPIDRHTIRATDQILGWVLGVKDQDGRQIYKSATRIGLTQSSVFRPGEDVYALLKIVDQGDTKKDNLGTVIQKQVECVLSLVFSVPAIDDDRQPTDIQAWADGLLEWTKLHLQPNYGDNPQGYTPIHNGFWRWSQDTNFSAKLQRGLTRMDDKPVEFSGTYYAMPYQFKIDVYVTVDLP